MNLKNSRIFLLLIGGSITLIDRLSKLAIIEWLPQGREIHLFDGDLIWIQHVLNPGMAFGMRLLPPLALAIVSAIAVIGLVYYILKFPQLPPNQGVPLALILGGAAGNMIDRIVYGKVVDFISIDFPDFIMHRWPTFNVADSAVLIGVFTLAITTVLSRKKIRTRPQPHKRGFFCIVFL